MAPPKGFAQDSDPDAPGIDEGCCEDLDDEFGPDTGTAEVVVKAYQKDDRGCYQHACHAVVRLVPDTAREGEGEGYDKGQKNADPAEPGYDPGVHPPARAPVHGAGPEGQGL